MYYSSLYVDYLLDYPSPALAKGAADPISRSAEATPVPLNSPTSMGGYDEFAKLQKESASACPISNRMDMDHPQSQPAWQPDLGEEDEPEDPKDLSSRTVIQNLKGELQQLKAEKEENNREMQHLRVRETHIPPCVS